MQGVSVRCAALLLAAALAGETWGFHSSLRRYTRQAIHCQAGDEACQMCSTSCNSVEESRLPECCEAYNACCDQYFQACKKCSSVAAKDKYFPEYCCASFTDCCHLITTFNAPVKAPEPVRQEPKLELKIPEVAAPKPTVFPGVLGSDAPVAPSAPLFPSHSPAPQAPAFPAPSHSPAPLAPAFPAPSHSPAPLAPALPVPRTQSKATRVLVGRQRSQSNVQPPQRSRAQFPGGQRTGRVSSRGRVF